MDVRKLIFLVSFVSLVMVGCGESPPSEAPSQADYQCTRTDDATQVERCTEDEECACGSHCAYGTCQSECAAAADCAGGEYCDAFGRCRAESDGAAAASVSADDAAQLRWLPASLALTDDGAAKPLRLIAFNQPVDKVRVFASEATEISCDGGQTFGDSCAHEPLEAGADAGKIVQARVASGQTVDLESLEELTIATRHRQFRVGVTFQPASMPDPEPEPAGPGVYRGTATVAAAGFSTRDPLPSEGEISRMQVPVQIRISGEGDAYVAELSDPAGIVFPAGDTVTLADLQSGADGWSLASPDYLYIGSEQAGPGEIQVAADFRAESVTWRGDSISFIGQTTYSGVTLEASAPYIRWRVIASREADLENALPTPGDSFELTTSVVDRAASETPAEANFAPNPRNLTSYDNATSYVRAGIVACSQRGGSPVGLSDSLLGDGSGDIACEGGETMKGMTVLESPLLSADTTLENCFDELDEDLGETATTTADCVDAARMKAVIAFGLEDTRRRALGDFRQEPDQGARLASYYFTQWMGVQAFVANQYEEVGRMNEVLSSSNQVEAAVDARSLLEKLNASWDVMLHPRFGVAWGLAPERALVDPDYRSDVVNEQLPVGPQQYAAPVAIARGVDSYIDLTGELLSREQASPQDFDAFRPLATRALRQSMLVYAMTQGLVDDSSVLGAPPWESSWAAARDGLAMSVAQVTSRLLDGPGLLGISDSDLPLYGIDDQDSAAKQFLAVSHFLLGRDLDGGVARSMLEDASATLDSARQSYVDYKEFNFRAELEQNSRERRITQIKKSYGGEIASLCNPSWISNEVLGFDDAKLDPDTCYLREETQGGVRCKFDKTEKEQRVTVGQLMSSLCVAHEMRDEYEESVSTGREDLDELIKSMPDERVAGAEIQSSTDDGRYTLTADNWPELSGQEVDVNALTTLIEQGSLRNEADVIRESRASCQAFYGSGYARPTDVPNSCRYTSDCPVGYACSEMVCRPEGDSPADNAECYRGQLGQMALQLRSAATEIEVANSELKEYSELYDNAIQGCIITQTGNERAEQTLQTHNETMGDWSKGKLAAQIAANAAGGAKDCTASGDFSGSITGSTVAVCGFAAAEAAAKSAVDGLEFRMNQLERAHEEAVQRIESDTEEKNCFNDARAHLVGARSATLKIKQAQQEMERQFVEFQDMKTTVDGLRFEGRNALEREQDRTVTPLATDFWIEERIGEYNRQFRIARRGLYVAMLAVEYELQLTYAGRLDILGARGLTDLDQALSDLTNEVIAGNIDAGSRPDRGVAVLSLRDDLLAVSDRADYPEGRHQLSAAQRLQVRLNSPQNAVYDETGRFLGVEIPFTLAPDGQQGNSSVPILSGRTCAERLWTVNASIQGEDLIRGSETQISQLEIRKRNSFYSQWCAESGRDQDYQLASVRPSRNLFVDPRSGAASGGQFAGEFGGEPRAFAKASVNSYINVGRAELEDEAYSNGDSIALAGRGIFGDYTLFIPVDSLSMSENKAGLVLNRVDDVLLRFDYVAALAN